MSAVSMQLAWEIGASVFHSSGDFDKGLNRPIPGTEAIKELPNPSVRIGLERREAALTLYNQPTYSAAIDAFAESRQWNRNHLFDDFALAVCRCYADWVDLNLASLSSHLDMLGELVREPLYARYFESAKTMKGHLDTSVKALRRVADGDELALIATYVELATLYRQQERHDFSALFSYRFMEACVHRGLKEKGGPKFKPNAAKFDLLDGIDESDLEERYRELSRATGFGRNVKLPRQIHFMDGFGILCLANVEGEEPLHRRLFDSESEADAIEKLKPITALRNKSALIHGNRSLNSADSEEILKCAEEVARAILQLDFGEIEKQRRQLKPLQLERFTDMR